MPWDSKLARWKPRMNTSTSHPPRARDPTFFNAPTRLPLSITTPSSSYRDRSTKLPRSCGARRHRMHRRLALPCHYSPFLLTIPAGHFPHIFRESCACNGQMRKTPHSSTLFTKKAPHWKSPSLFNYRLSKIFLIKAHKFVRNVCWVNDRHFYGSLFHW